MEQELERLRQICKRNFRRNKSILDTISKLQVSMGKAERSIIKSATHCGCTEIIGKKQPPALEGEAESLFCGKLCADCRARTAQYLGDTLFYLLSLLWLLDISPESVIQNQAAELELLGKFNLK